MSIPRDVVIGRNSAVWRGLSSHSPLMRKFTTAIGHTDVSTFDFKPGDRVWIFSYSLIESENDKLFDGLAKAGIKDVVYVSSATVNVARITTCYRYPRTKRRAEESAVQILSARILRLGLVYADLNELPGGVVAATSSAQVANFLLEPHWPQDGLAPVNLFDHIATPFRSGPEERLHRWYGFVQSHCGRWPCVLRPLDYGLRLLGCRWYGYVYLSNKLWNLTTS